MLMPNAKNTEILEIPMPIGLGARLRRDAQIAGVPVDELARDTLWRSVLGDRSGNSEAVEAS